MKRFILAALLASVYLPVSAADIVPAPPQVGAKAYLLIDADSGAVLAEGNADMPLPPASLTKLMTSYVLASELASGRVGHDDLVVVRILYSMGHH